MFCISDAPSKAQSYSSVDSSKLTFENHMIKSVLVTTIRLFSQKKDGIIQVIDQAMIHYEMTTKFKDNYINF
jgi:hypothetical protein